MKTNIFILSFSFYSICFCSYSQDPQFYQIFANPLYLNPAFAGTQLCPRFIMNLRDDVYSSNRPSLNVNSSYDQFVTPLKGGLGVLVTHNNFSGMIKTTYASGLYSYHFNKLKKITVIAGLQVTYFKINIDWENSSGSGSTINNSFDFSSGLLAYSKRLYGGGSIHHFLSPMPYEGFAGMTNYRLPIKLTLHGGGLFPIGKSVKTEISLNLIFIKQQNFWQFLSGLYVTRGPIVGGIWFRQAQKTSDYISILLGFKYKMIKIGYSYATSISRLSNVSAGSHEISLQVQLGCKYDKDIFRTVNSPSF